MTSLKKHWDCYAAEYKSPQIFLDLSFYWMIGAALQRRVWLAPQHKPIFPCLYVFLCGPPGVGKGLVINDVYRIMGHHKFKPANAQNNGKLDSMIAKLEKEGATPETLAMLRASKAAMAEVQDVGKEKVKGEPLLFPMSADSTTFQSLVQQHAQSVRTHHIGRPHPMAPSGLYTYHSFNIIIEEASSMFNEHSKLIAEYLLKAYNCESYKYKTKHFGEDTIPRCTLSLLAGTTPSFMSEVFDAKLFKDGFSARTIFGYGAKARFMSWKIPDHTPEQKMALDMVLRRLKELGSLFGQVELSPDAEAYMDSIYLDKNEGFKKNKDPRLESYYERHSLQVRKLAMCVHFADHDSLVIEQHELEAAQDILAGAEDSMHLALGNKGRNPVAELQKKIWHWFQEEAEPKLFIHVYGKFIDDAWNNPEVEIQNALDFLVWSGRLEQSGNYYKKKGTKEQ